MLAGFSSLQLSRSCMARGCSERSADTDRTRISVTIVVRTCACREDAHQGGRSFNGDAVAGLICDDLRKRIAVLPRPPHLAVLLVGDDHPSRIFLTRKRKAADFVGIQMTLVEMKAASSHSEVLEKIREMNEVMHAVGLLRSLYRSNCVVWLDWPLLASPRSVELRRGVCGLLPHMLC